MGVIPKRPYRARSEDAWSPEENEPFLGGDPSGSINEKDPPIVSKFINSPSRSFWAIKLVMALLTAVVFGAFLRGVVGSAKEEPSVCTSPACIHASSDILYNLDPDYKSIDPCTDFDQFACGGWVERHDMRSDQAEIATGNVMSEQAQSILLHILDDEESGNNTARCPGESVDDKNFCKVKAAYDACMNKDLAEEKGIKPLQNVLDKVVELYPVEGGKDNSLTQTLLYFGDIGVEALLSLSTSADDRDPDSVAIFVTPPTEIGLPSKEYYNDTETVADYKEVVGKVLVEFGEGESTDSQDLAQDVVDFETKLADASPDTAASGDVTQYYNPLSVSETEALLPQVSIENIISTWAPEGFKPKRLIVGSPSYMESLAKILKETPNATIQAFLKWKVIQGYVTHVEAPVLTPLRRFNNQLQGKDPDAVEERWRQCVDEVDVSLGWILSRLFLQEAFSEDSKKYGNQIVSDIKDRFVTTLEGTEWMTEDVRDMAIEKVGNIVQKIGFPTKSPNIEDPKQLQKYYENLEVANNTFFANALAVSKFENNNQWAKLGKPTNRDEWGMTVPTVNAYYNPPGNEIVFPAGIMQSPVFYDSSAPRFLTYGSFGAVAGHELSHAFDSTGRHYDEIGNYTNWWDNKTIEAFENRTSCFVDQYSKFTVPGPGSEPIHVNGELTLGENIADAGGLKASYHAWKKHDKATPDAMLPGLDEFTKEKLFFVAYSTFWCSKTRKEAAIERIYSDPHAPKPFRILGTLANSREFKEAFDCPVKEPTCELW